MLLRSLLIAAVALTSAVTCLQADEIEDRVNREAEQRAEYMRRWDRNEDGVISPDEVSGRSRESFQRRLRTMGVDPERPISLEKYLNERRRMDMADARGEEYRPERSVDPEMAFGVTDDSEKVPGFEEPLSTDERKAAGLSGGGSDGKIEDASRQVRAADDRIKRYVKGLIERYDKNNDGVLDRDESRDVRGGRERYDTNRDGRITYEEAVLALSNYTSNRRDDGDSSNDGDRNDESDRRDDDDRDRRREESSRDDDRRRERTNDDRRSYRFTPAIERLPSGTPSWFIDKDDNEDGQVAMAEYASSWSSSRVRDFAAYDHNGDGIITAKEAIQGKQ